MRKTLSYLTVAAGALLLSGAGLPAAEAQGSPPADRPGFGRRFQQQLGLSDDQMSQLRALRNEQRKARIRSSADLRIARLELEELLSAATIDEKAVAAKTKQLSDLQAAALRARVDARLAMRKVLTPEQAQKLGEMRSRGGRFPGRGLRGRPGEPGRGRRGPGRGPGPGPDGPGPEPPPGQ